MLTIYGRANSSNVQAVMWCVGELAIEHTRLDYGHVHGGTDTKEYLAMNPHGVVPTLVDGDDKAIFESGAITRYLAAKYGSESFWPSDPAKRAQIDQWAEWVKTTYGPAFSVPIFWQRVRVAASDRDAEALIKSIAKFECLLERVANHMGDNPYVCGNALTVADIMIGHLLYRYFDIDIKRNPNPRIEKYYDLLTQRTPYREHVMVDYSALRAKGA